MSITYTPPAGSPVTLPDGLRWRDEFDWSPIAQSRAYSLSGALIVEEAARQAGQPMTLLGGLNFAWLTRQALLALHTALAAEGAAQIELHDGRRFSVIPDRADPGPLSAAAVPVVRDSGPADPGPDARYYIDELRLLVLEQIT